MQRAVHQHTGQQPEQRAEGTPHLSTDSRRESGGSERDLSEAVGKKDNPPLAEKVLEKLDVPQAGRPCQVPACKLQERLFCSANHNCSPRRTDTSAIPLTQVRPATNVCVCPVRDVDAGRCEALTLPCALQRPEGHAVSTDSAPDSAYLRSISKSAVLTKQGAKHAPVATQERMATRPRKTAAAPSACSKEVGGPARPTFSSSIAEAGALSSRGTPRPGTRPYWSRQNSMRCAQSPSSLNIAVVVCLIKARSIRDLQ